MRVVSAGEAHQTFYLLLQEVERGAEVVIARCGKPVARLMPLSAHRSPEQEQAAEHMIALMREGLSLGGRRFTRDEMHER